MTRTWLIPGGLLLAAVALLLAGCSQPLSPNNLVTIPYEEIVACNGLASDSVVMAPPNTAFVVFRLLTADNRNPQAQSFAFDPSKVYVNSARVKAYATAAAGLPGGSLFPPQYHAQAFTVAPGVDVAILASPNIGEGGYVTVNVPTAAAAGNQEAAKTRYTLLFDGAPQGVLMSWVNAPDAPASGLITHYQPLNVCKETSSSQGTFFVENQ